MKTNSSLVATIILLVYLFLWRKGVRRIIEQFKQSFMVMGKDNPGGVRSMIYYVHPVIPVWGFTNIHNMCWLGLWADEEVTKDSL